jgi:hypothetical protein
MTQSPELAGGAGFTYADQVTTRYLAALLLGSGAPGLTERRVVRVALRRRAANGGMAGREGFERPLHLGDAEN